MTDTPEAVSLAVLRLARAGRFADIHDLLAPQLRAVATADVLRAGWESELTRRGPVAANGMPVSEPGTGGATLVRIPVTCERGGFTLLVVVTGAGRLASLQLASASAATPAAPWQPPDYADPEAFDEQDITLGPEPLAVQGTLSLPREPATVPGVVLLAGSGPRDRDETLGRNKLFKDVAWGLASHRVAVLRLDKVTSAHPAAVRDNPDFTLADEYVTHGVAAVRYLGHQPGIDPHRVFLLGHSLGGTAAPRVAAAEPAVAGLILMAGGAQPLHWSAVRQVRYLASLDPATAPAAQPAIDSMTRQARLVDSADLSPSTPASDLPFGVPAPYWLDLRSYQPAVVAASLGKPILILQGARDYQVTIADDLAVWKTGLANRQDVTIRIYEAGNHCFFSGTGPPSPAEYEPAQHVDPDVITDIAGWLST